MLAYTFPTLEDAEAFVALLDQALGFPHRGVNVGGGVHMDVAEEPGPGWTLHASEPFLHPTSGAFAVPVTDAFVPVCRELLGAEALELGEDWFPPRPGG